MIHRIYSIYDSAAGIYLPPFLMQRDAMAIRALSDVVNSKEHPIAQHPKDFTLFHLGSFDDSLGVYMNAEHGPKAICTALSLLVPAAPDRNQLDLIDNPPKNQGMM